MQRKLKTVIRPSPSAKGAFVGRERLLPVDVQRCGQRAVLKAFQQGGLVNQPGARGVHQDGARLHLLELPRTDSADPDDAERAALEQGAGRDADLETACAHGAIARRYMPRGCQSSSTAILVS